MVVSFLLRPAPEHWLRRPWNLVHWWWGRLIAVVALGNFFFGLWMLNSGLVWYIVPAAIIAAFLIASALKVRLQISEPASQQVYRWLNTVMRSGQKFLTLHLREGIHE